MNKEWNDALNEIRDSNLQEAGQYKPHRHFWFRAVAAVLVLVIGWGVIWHELSPTPEAPKPVISGKEPAAVHTPGKIQSPGALHLANLAAAPEYPEMVPCPNWNDYEDYSKYSDDYDAWHLSCREQYDQPEGYADSLDSFFLRSIPEFLSGEGNRAYSPLNVYLATAMLAEISGGNSRQQILNLLGVESIEALRTQAGHVWNAHYRNDGQSTSLLAGSLWLDDEYTFKNETVQTLVNSYYASVFRGALESKELNEQLRSWINAQTGGLLQEQAGGLEMPEQTVLALASTIFFSADWDVGFSEENNTEGLFHCKEFDQTTTFMNQSFTYGTYYWGEDFGAVRMDLTGDSGMWLILPDEDKTVEDVLESGEYWTLTQDPGAWKNKKSIKINLSLPKFDITAQADLIDGMKKLGITDVFDKDHADFSPMVDGDGLFIGKIDHAARVAVDEEGVIAAAYTVMMMYNTGMPIPPDGEIDFVLDRPFLFAVTSRDNLPLFTGVVEQP